MATKYSFRRYNPLSLRLWHWLNAAVILGLLGTVLLRKTFLSWRANAAIIEDKMQTAGVTITPEMAKDIAVSIRNPMWDWHIYLGFTLGILLVVRIFIALLQRKNLPSAPLFCRLSGIKSISKNEQAKAFHYYFVQTGYALVYLSIIFMVASGLMMNFKNELGLSKDFFGLIKEAHELLMWFFVIFTVGHLIGVVIAENRDDKGLISDMIHGGDHKT